MFSIAVMRIGALYCSIEKPPTAVIAVWSPEYTIFLFTPFAKLNGCVLSIYSCNTFSFFYYFFSYINVDRYFETQN